MVVVNIPRYRYAPEGDKDKPWLLLEDFLYYSRRYNKYVKLEAGMRSDGATGARDIISAAWWVHDELTESYTWRDGTECTRWQSSNVIADILKDEGHWFIDGFWKYATMLPKWKSDIRRWLGL